MPSSVGSPASMYFAIVHIAATNWTKVVVVALIHLWLLHVWFRNAGHARARVPLASLAWIQMIPERLQRWLHSSEFEQLLEADAVLRGLIAPPPPLMTRWCPGCGSLTWNGLLSVL